MSDQGTVGGGSVSPMGSGTPGAQGAMHAIKDEAKRVVGDAREGTATIASQAQGQAAEAVGRTQKQTAERLMSLASALRQAGDQLERDDAASFGRYAGLAADQVQRASDYLQGKDLGELTRDTETFARRHPDLFLGGAFLAGVMLARFLKSSPDGENGESTVSTAAEGQPFNAPHFADETPASTAGAATSGGL